MKAVQDKRILNALNNRLKGGINNDRPIMVSELEGIINDIVDLVGFLRTDGSNPMTGLLTLSGDPVNPLNPVTLQYLSNIVTTLINGAPSSLDTLGEIANAINNDPNFNATITNRITNVENYEFKILYYESISTTTGTITKPTNTDIILSDFPSGYDAVVETIVNGEPTGEIARTSGGVAITVSSFDLLGNYTLSGTPSTTPIAFLYVLKVKGKYLSNLIFDNIIESQNTSSSQASNVTFVPNGDIGSTNVQDAIVEVRDDTDIKLGLKVDKTITVNGHLLSSNVTVSKSDVGLGNADNTSDINKPVSTAQATADTNTLNSANTYSDSKVIDSIVDADTTHAPSRNSVFDALALKQNSLGYTAENLANKSTDINTDQASNIKYGGVKAIYDWATGLFATITNLTLKADKVTITGATKTKITYNSQGIITAGVDATTADIADSTNKRYQTDNQQSYNDATSSIQTQLNLKEFLTNKATDFSILNNTLYPTTQAVENEILRLLATLDAKPDVQYASTSALPAYTYNNGSSGVGSTWTGNINGPLIIDGVTILLAQAGQKVLIAGESDQSKNGWADITQVGVIGLSPYILTRSTSSDQPSEIGAGYLTGVVAVNSFTAGSNNGKVYISIANDPFTIGTTALTFSQVGGTYTNGAGLTLSGNIFSISAGAITNSMLSGGITDSNLNSVYLYADGSRGLLGNWIAGAWYMTINKIGIGTGSTAPTTILHVIETSTSTSRGILSDQYNSGTQGARITMRKARGVFSTPLVIVTGDVLASWTASGYDGSNFIDGAKILVTSIGSIGTGIVPTTMALQTMNTSGALLAGITIDQSQNSSFAGTINGINISPNVVGVGTDTYTATLSPVPLSYIIGNSYKIKIPNTNTITNPTLNINSLGAKTIVASNSISLPIGFFVANGWYDFVYDGTNLVVNAGLADRRDESYYRKIGTVTLERWYSSNSAGFTSTTVGRAKDLLVAIPFIVSKTITLDRIGMGITGAGTAASVIRLAIYDDVNGIPTNLILDAGTIAGDSATFQSININQTLTPGLYYLTFNHNSVATITFTSMPIGALLPTLGLSNNLASASAGMITSTLVYTTMPSTFTLTGISATNVTNVPIISVRLSA